MNNFQRYIRYGEEEGAPSAEAVGALVDKYPWFTVAREVAEHLSGAGDPIQMLLRQNRGLSSLHRPHIDTELLTEVTEGEIIDRFLRMDDYRIVADEGGSDDTEIKTEADIDGDDDIVSEELAEVYAAQGLKEEAIEIYRKLSLRNTEKSVYFAEKIEKLANNN